VSAPSQKKSLHFKRWTEHIVQSYRQITSIGQRPSIWLQHTHAAFHPKLHLVLTTHLFSMLSLKARKHRRRMEGFPIPTNLQSESAGKGTA
jgi:hypothetical protein